MITLSVSHKVIITKQIRMIAHLVVRKKKKMKNSKEINKVSVVAKRRKNEKMNNRNHLCLNALRCQIRILVKTVANIATLNLSMNNSKMMCRI